MGTAGHHGQRGRLGMSFSEGHTAKERGNDGHGRRGRREFPALNVGIIEQEPIQYNE